MREYLLIPKSEWSDLTKEHLPLDVLKRLLGAFNPDDSEFMHGTGPYSVPRKVIDAKYWGDISVTNKVENVDVASKSGGLIAQGEFNAGKDAPISEVRDSEGNIIVNNVHQDYPGRRISSSIKELKDTVYSWITKKPYVSPYADLDLPTGNPRFYEDATIDVLTMPKRKTYLFSWDEIPGKKSEKLFEYLKKNYGIDWLGSAKIDKLDDGKIIKIYTEKNTLSLKRDGKNPEVVLEIDDGRTDTLYSNSDKDRLMIYGKPKNKYGKQEDRVGDKATVAGLEKKIWGPARMDVLNENGDTVVKIQDNIFKWFSPAENLIGESHSDTWVDKLLKPLYKLPLPIGLNSGYDVTVPNVGGRDIKIYKQRKNYKRLGALLGRHLSDLTFYEGTDNEAKAEVRAVSRYLPAHRLFNPYFYIDFIKMKIHGTPAEFPGGRYRAGGYALGYFSPIESIKVSRKDEKGKIRGGEITITDPLPFSDPVLTFWKYTPDGSLLFDFSKLDQDETYQQIITSRIWHVDPDVSRRMEKAKFTRHLDGKIYVEYVDPKNPKESKILGRFEIYGESKKCYFRLQEDWGVGEHFSGSGDIEIGDVRDENGALKVYSDKMEIGRIVSQLTIKNLEEAVFYKDKAVSEHKSVLDLLDYIPNIGDTLADIIGEIPQFGIKKTKKEKKMVSVPYLDLDKIVREHKVNVFTPGNRENAIEYMSMLIALCGVGAEDMGLAKREWILDDLNIYKLPKRADRVLDLITATEKEHNPNLNFENGISVLIGPNLLPEKLSYALKDMFGIEEPEELRHHHRDAWSKNESPAM